MDKVSFKFIAIVGYLCFAYSLVVGFVYTASFWIILPIPFMTYLSLEDLIRNSIPPLIACAVFTLIYLSQVFNLYSTRKLDSSSEKDKLQKFNKSGKLKKTIALKLQLYGLRFLIRSLIVVIFIFIVTYLLYTTFYKLGIFLGGVIVLLLVLLNYLINTFMSGVRLVKYFILIWAFFSVFIPASLATVDARDVLYSKYYYAINIAEGEYKFLGKLGGKYLLINANNKCVKVLSDNENLSLDLSKVRNPEIEIPPKLFTDIDQLKKYPQNGSKGEC